jgi:hypothetical protein
MKYASQCVNFHKNTKHIKFITYEYLISQKVEHERSCILNHAFMQELCICLNLQHLNVKNNLNLMSNLMGKCQI